MGKGGTSGKIGFPEYLESVHKYLIARPDDPDTIITTRLVDIINDMLSGNPYAGATFTDPSTLFNSTNTRYSAFDSLVTDLNPTTDWQGFIDVITSKFNQAGILDPVDVDSIFSDARQSSSLQTNEAIAASIEAINDVVVKGMVKAFEKRADDQRRRATNRFTGTMSDINAVQSSAFIFGMAIIESAHMQAVDEFDANITSQIYQGAFTAHMQTFQAEISGRLQEAISGKRSRDQLVGQSTGLMTQALYNKAELDKAAASIRAELNRIEFVGTKEYETGKLEINVKDALWDMETFKHAGNFLGTLGGGAFVPPGPTKAQSAIGGTLSGVASGARIGGAPGAVIGGMMGLAASF